MQGTSTQETAPVPEFDLLANGAAVLLSKGSRKEGQAIVLAITSGRSEFATWVRVEHSETSGARDFTTQGHYFPRTVEGLRHALESFEERT